MLLYFQIQTVFVPETVCATGAPVTVLEAVLTQPPVVVTLIDH
jgi:hypothetical protein